MVGSLGGSAALLAECVLPIYSNLARLLWQPKKQVFLLLTLPGESERLSITGQVVWVSPEGVSGRRIPGIGLHFSQQDYPVRDRIETLLAGQLDKAAPSFTL